jgi:hypothetical protein
MPSRVTHIQDMETGETEMTALEKLNKMAADIHAETLRLQKSHATSAQASALMAKHGCKKIADALYAEALERVGA